MTVKLGIELVFGVADVKPLVGFPEGRQRLRLRNTEFAVVYIRPPAGGIRKFTIVDSGDVWEPGPEQGRNEVPV